MKVGFRVSRTITIAGGVDRFWEGPGPFERWYLNKIGMTNDSRPDAILTYFRTGEGGDPIDFLPLIPISSQEAYLHAVYLDEPLELVYPMQIGVRFYNAANGDVILYSLAGLVERIDIE